MLQRRPSSLATMLGIVVLVAVVLVLLTHPGRQPVQPADFAALAADPACTAGTSVTGDGFTLTVDLDEAFAGEQTVYQGSYGSIVLAGVTDVSQEGCTLLFTASGGMDSDGRACLVSGALPGADGALLTAEVLLEPDGCRADFGAGADFTATGNGFSLRITVPEGQATPEGKSRQVTLTLRSLPQVVFSKAS